MDMKANYPTERTKNVQAVQEQRAQQVAADKFLGQRERYSCGNSKGIRTLITKQ